jgi:hypothetical protein
MSEQEMSLFCNEHGISDYTICEDSDGFYIDVAGSVNLSYHGLSSIPVRFGYVSGFFDCTSNSLRTLVGCPKYVGNFFDCSYNELVSLKGCPKYVGGIFNCYNNYLTSLVYSPKEVLGSFNCSNNRMTSLEGCPKTIGDSFFCSRNRLTSLLHSPVSDGKMIISYDNTSLNTECYNHLFELGYDIGSIGCNDYNIDLVSLRRQWVLKGIINE